MKEVFSNNNKERLLTDLGQKPFWGNAGALGVLFGAGGRNRTDTNARFTGF